MHLSEAFYKIVENPASLENYSYIKKYFQEKGIENIASAFGHLIEVRYGNDNNPEQNQQDRKDN